MLNKAERYGVLNRHRILCALGLLPVEVDLASWKLKKPLLGKRILCLLSYICFVLHTLYKAGSLAYAYFLVPHVQIHQLVTHGVAAMGGVVAVIFYFKVYICDLALLSAYFNVTHVGYIGGHIDPEDRLEKPWTERIMEYSLQDLIALFLPYMLGTAIPLVIASYLYAPSMRLLLYAILPGQLQTWIAFGLCTLEEVRYFVVTVAITAPMLQMQVISYDLVSKQLQRLIRNMQNGTHGPRSVYRSLRCLQMYVSVLNCLNSDLVFIMKLLTVSFSILCGYAAVAHFREFPIFGIMFHIILVDAVLCYAFIYQRAFRVPQLFNRASADALLHMGANRRTAFGKQMMSIPAAAIKVGSFHKMERASTLIFMNFVVVNIVNMLVAYG